MDRIAPKKESKAPLEGRTVLITGGGRGIGAATSKLLASRGANIIVNYLRNKVKQGHRTTYWRGCNCYSSRCKRCRSGSAHG